MFDFPQYSFEKSSLPKDTEIAYSHASRSFHAIRQEVFNVEGIDKTFWRHAIPLPQRRCPIEHGWEDIRGHAFGIGWTPAKKLRTPRKQPPAGLAPSSVLVRRRDVLRELAKLSEGMLFLGGHVANAETARLLARFETSPLMQTNDNDPFAGTGMTTSFPTAQEYSAQKARHPAMSVVDIRSEQAAITDSYRNQVLLDVNEGCLRLAVFEGEYRWHHHPDSDELFLVVAGELQVDFEHGTRAVLTEWQSLVVPAGTMHRTRAIGRTVNVTFEKRHARTVFVEPAHD